MLFSSSKDGWVSSLNTRNDTMDSSKVEGIVSLIDPFSLKAYLKKSIIPEDVTIPVLTVSCELPELKLHVSRSIIKAFIRLYDRVEASKNYSSAPSAAQTNVGPYELNHSSIPEKADMRPNESPVTDTPPEQELLAAESLNESLEVSIMQLEDERGHLVDNSTYHYHTPNYSAMIPYFLAELSRIDNELSRIYRSQLVEDKVAKDEISKAGFSKSLPQDRRSFFSCTLSVSKVSVFVSSSDASRMHMGLPSVDMDDLIRIDLNGVRLARHDTSDGEDTSVVVTSFVMEHISPPPISQVEGESSRRFCVASSVRDDEGMLSKFDDLLSQSFNSPIVDGTFLETFNMVHLCPDDFILIQVQKKPTESKNILEERTIAVNLQVSVNELLVHLNETVVLGILRMFEPTMEFPAERCKVLSMTETDMDEFGTPHSSFVPGVFDGEFFSLDDEVFDFNGKVFSLSDEAEVSIGLPSFSPSKKSMDWSQTSLGEHDEGRVSISFQFRMQSLNILVEAMEKPFSLVCIDDLTVAFSEVEQSKELIGSVGNLRVFDVRFRDISNPIEIFKKQDGTVKSFMKVTVKKTDDGGICKSSLTKLCLRLEVSSYFFLIYPKFIDLFLQNIVRGMLPIFPRAANNDESDGLTRGEQQRTTTSLFFDVDIGSSSIVFPQVSDLKAVSHNLSLEEDGNHLAINYGGVRISLRTADASEVVNLTLIAKSLSIGFPSQEAKILKFTNLQATLHFNPPHVSSNHNEPKTSDHSKNVAIDAQVQMSKASIVLVEDMITPISMCLKENLLELVDIISQISVLFRVAEETASLGFHEGWLRFCRL